MGYKLRKGKASFMNQDSAVGFIVGAGLALWLSVPTSDIQEKTVYFSYCPDFKHNVYACPEITRVSKMSFKVFLKEQLVISDVLDPLKSCKVFDNDNWQCSTAGNSYHFVVMRDGDYWRTAFLEGSLDENGEKSSMPLDYQIWASVYYSKLAIDFFR